MKYLLIFILSVAVGFAAAPAFAITVSVTNHGAAGDGKALNTAAIQAAVDDCSGKGGGTVLVPAGVWLTGSVELTSHLTLRLESGAV
jgi:polygalacturonase